MKLNDRVSVLSAELVTGDPYNPSTTTVRNWANAAEKLEPADMDALTSTEVVVNQDTVVSRYRVTLLPVTSATSASRIKWHDRTFEVDGEVEPITDHRGRTHHHEAFLRRASG